MKCVKCGTPIYPDYLTLCADCRRKEAENKPRMTFETSGIGYSTENKLIGKFKIQEDENG